MRLSLLLIAVCLLVSIARAGDSVADERTPAISVIGSGSAQFKPAVVEISAWLSAEAELVNDARVRVHDARQRAADAVEKIPGVKLESRGLTINPPLDPNALINAQRQMIVQNGVVMNMPNQQNFARRISVIEQVRVVLRDANKLESAKLIETVAQLIDNARDAGLQIGPVNTSAGVLGAMAQPQPSYPLIVCKASNSSAVREQAYKSAIEDARQKASVLAGAAGLKVGKVIAVREMETASDPATGPQAQEADVSSLLLGELTMNVRLAVQFEIAK